MIFAELRRPWFFVSRNVLWLPGTLALLGGLWREPTTPDWTTVALLAGWVELTVLLCRVPAIFGRNPGEGGLHGLCRHTTNPKDREFNSQNQRPSTEAGSQTERKLLVVPPSWVSWLPVIFLAAILPIRAWPVYFVLLVFFEAVRAVVPRRTVAGSEPPSRADREMSLPGAAIQRLSRMRDDHGRERLECLYLVEFAPDQETASVHIPFCPGFESPPRVVASLEEGAPARLTIRRPFFFGVRIDVRRTGPASRFLLFVDVEGPPDPKAEP